MLRTFIMVEKVYSKCKMMWYPVVGLLFSFTLLVSVVNSNVRAVPVLLLESIRSNKIQRNLRIETKEFKQCLLKKINDSKKQLFPKLVIFLEDELSVEDFSWRDQNRLGHYPNLERVIKNISLCEFFPSVLSPMKAIQDLTEYGYIMKYMHETDLLPENDQRNIVWVIQFSNIQNKTQLLRSHDNLIAVMCSELFSIYNDVVILYTGIQSSWDVKMRLKRNLNSIHIKYQHNHFLSKKTSLLIWQIQKVLLISKDVPFIRKEDKSVIRLIEDPVISMTENEDNNVYLHAEYYGDHNLSFIFHFYTHLRHWKLNSIEYNGESKIKDILLPIFDISAPVGMSWHSSLPVLFISNTTIDLIFQFNDLQIEVFVSNNSAGFNPAVDVITFFTPTILSVLFVVSILLGIIFFGILMSFNIETNDQFDDPKSKSLVIIGD